MLYLISYDLRLGATADDYARIDTFLTNLGGRRVLLSQWVLRSHYGSTQLRDAVRTAMDGNDRLLVTEIANDNWASYNVMISINDV